MRLCGTLYKDIFRIQLNIYHKAFLQKCITAFSRSLFLQKSSITDVQLRYKFGSTTYRYTFVSDNNNLKISVWFKLCFARY